VREHLSEADGKIVFDNFHVAKHLGDAVDKVRWRENKTLKAAGDDRLNRTRYDWLRNPASMEPKDRKEFAELRNSELKTGRAWALKETAMAFTSISTSGQQGNISGGGTTGPCEVSSNR
jgi:transposase